MTPTTGLTAFLTRLAASTPADRAAARGREEAIASKHGLPVDWVRFYVEWMG